MKILKLTLTYFVTAALLVSCTTDNPAEPNTDENTVTLKKSITYTPQQSNFTQKLVKYFENNKIVADSTFNNLNQLTARSVFTYNSGNRTKFNYNASNSLISKIIHSYDNLHRLLSVNQYNPADQLTHSTTFEYQNENIYMTTHYNGISTLKYHYKTNADGYLYYEKDLTNNDFVRTLDYSGNKPTQLHYGIEDYTADYNYHPQMKPLNMQSSPIETNNLALGNFFMEHVHFSCNYYLEQIVFNIGTDTFSVERDYILNENNYETYLKTYGMDVNGVQNNYSETFTFYN